MYCYDTSRLRYGGFFYCFNDSFRFRQCRISENLSVFGDDVATEKIIVAGTFLTKTVLCHSVEKQN